MFFVTSNLYLYEVTENGTRVVICENYRSDGICKYTRIHNLRKFLWNIRNVMTETCLYLFHINCYLMGTTKPGLLT
jgi:hypothetical protein